VHILAQGRIVASGGPELAVQLETDGYAAFAADIDAAADEPTSSLDDLFAF
jgi:Fe-S cluster assembly ATPase SufC